MLTAIKLLVIAAIWFKKIQFQETRKYRHVSNFESIKRQFLFS